MLDAEQQEVLLADAGVEVLLNLRRCEYAIVDRDEADHARPGAITRDFVAEHESEGVVPVGQQCRPVQDPVRCNEHAVDIDLAALDRVESHDDVLQRRLQHLSRVGRGDLRVAVAVRLAVRLKKS